MAKTGKPVADKAAKAEAKAARKAASKERRSQLWQAFQIQRKEDTRLLPYMIGAFVLIVAVAVVVGVVSGSVFTMATLIPLGVVLGALVAFIIFGRRAQKSVYRKAEGQTGAAAWARQVAGHPRGGRDRALRRGAPRHRSAGGDLRRRGFGDPGEAPAGPGEEAHRAAHR
jgi:Domain of unknown function (DUF4191)